MLTNFDHKLLAIDWENAGLGHPSIDIGNFLGALCSLWLEFKVRNNSKGFSEILSSGSWKSAEFFQLVMSIFTTYIKYSKLDISDTERLDSLRYAGIFLMTRAWVSNSTLGRHNLHSHMCLELGLKMAKTPETLMNQLSRVDIADAI